MDIAITTDLGETKEDKALQQVQRFMKKSSHYREAFENEWARCLSEYLNSRAARANGLQRANLKIPYAFTIVETVTPQLVDAFTGEETYLTMTSRTQRFAELGVDLSDYFTFQLDEARYLEKLTCLFKTSSIYGTGIAKIGWKTVYREDEDYGEMVEFDGPDLTNIDLMDFYPDWGVTTPGDIQAMRGCVHRVYRTFKDIKAREKKTVGRVSSGVYRNLDKLEESMRDRGGDAWENMSKPKDDAVTREQEGRLGIDSGEKTVDKLELWEYWGDFHYKGECYQYVITVANGDTVIRCDTMPGKRRKKPFLAAIKYPLPGEFYGIGDLAPVLSLMKEGATVRNARLDQIIRAINRMWLVDRNAGINLRTLYDKPSGIIVANDINGIKLLDSPETPYTSSKEVAQIEYDIQNATAQVNTSQPVSNMGRAFGKTATGVSFMQAATNSRLGLTIKMIESSFIKELGKFLVELNFEYGKDGFSWKKIHGDKPNPFEMLPYAIFEQQFDFYASGALERTQKANRQATLQQVIAPFLQVLEKSDPKSVKWDGLAKTIFREFDWRNMSELIRTPEEKAQLMQQEQQAQQQAMQAQMQAEMQKEASLQSVQKDGKIEQEQVRGANKMNQLLVSKTFEMGSSLLNSFVKGPSNGPPA